MLKHNFHVCRVKLFETSCYFIIESFSKKVVYFVLMSFDTIKQIDIDLLLIFPQCMIFSFINVVLTLLKMSFNQVMLPSLM